MFETRSGPQVLTDVCDKASWRCINKPYHPLTGKLKVNKINLIFTLIVTLHTLINTQA